MSALRKPASDLLFTTADLLTMPEDGKLYEIIEGELYASTQPNWHHQYACARLLRALENWDEQTGLGVANGAPGLIFGIHDAVAPDVEWVSLGRLLQDLGEGGKLHDERALVVEVVSAGWR